MLCKPKFNQTFFIFLLAFALLPSVFAFDNFTITDYGLEWVSLSWDSLEDINIYYSLDNETYYDIQMVDELNKVALQQQLNYDTTYYFMITNSSNNQTLTQKTKDIYESNYFFVYTVMLLMVLSLTFLYITTSDVLFSSTAGFLLLFMVLNISRVGFINIGSAFLSNALVVVLLGFSYILLIVPNLNAIGGFVND